MTPIQPDIRTLKERKLAGLLMSMSFSNNTTTELWKNFMPRRKEIQNAVGSNLYAMQLYPPHFFDAFDASKEFTKWAATEVSNFEKIPEGMESFTLSGGLYAVFYYKGLNTDSSIFQYIHGTWLPQSEYQLDYRPHFEILGEKYKNNDPASEEEIWIPVKLK